LFSTVAGQSPAAAVIDEVRKKKLKHVKNDLIYPRVKYWDA
jgi:hypothetical protein